jgi:hypothetical protein
MSSKDLLKGKYDQYDGKEQYQSDADDSLEEDTGKVEGLSDNRIVECKNT